MFTTVRGVVLTLKGLVCRLEHRQHTFPGGLEEAFE